MNHINFSITHIGTATAILNINGINILTDPAFPDANWKAPGDGTSILKNPEIAAMTLADLPHIDGILLSHEDHDDNLDSKGRTLLQGRTVLTTMDGKTKLGANPSIYGMRPWDTREVVMGGQKFTITATPCKHFPGGECIGFLVQADVFGKSSASGLPNAIYFSGDTVYIDELKEIAKRVHVTVALLNLGSAHVPNPDGSQLQITMDGKQAAQLFKDIGAEILVPMHFASWSHFAEGKDGIVKAFDEAGLSDKVQWLTPGKEQKIY